MNHETTICSVRTLALAFGDESVPLWGLGDSAASMGTVPEVWGQLAPMLITHTSVYSCIPSVKSYFSIFLSSFSKIIVLFHVMQCSRQVALSSFYTQMFQPPTKLGVIGSGCSVATEATAEVAYYFNLTQVSFRDKQ